MLKKKSKYIVFAWELGAGYGHVAGIRPLAEAFLQRGYRVSVIARYLHSATTVLGDLECDIYQAPFFSDKFHGSGITYTYPEILLRFGYHKLASLKQTLDPWCNLLKLLKPDLVVIDHGPTALLACRCEEVKYITFSTGFFLPPNTKPSPTFIGMRGENAIEQQVNEQIVLTTINAALARKGRSLLEKFTDLFYPAEHLLCTLPELDHYPNREGIRYDGPRFDIDMGETIDWPKIRDMSAPKVFAYVKEESIGFETLFQALLLIPLPVLLHIPGASEAIINRSKQAPNLKLHKNPVNMRNVQREANLIICHGGHGVVSSSLIAGVRLLLLPDQLEQSMLTSRLVEQRLALAMTKETRSTASKEKYFEAIATSLTNKVMGKQLLLFTEKYKDFNQSAQLSKLIKICQNIIEN
jgi:UDP:flavonoid glycosyltransferase YjiC (YdhE family)